MGSHHRQVAILVPDDKLDCFGYSGNNLALSKTVKLFIRDQYCHLGLKAPHCSGASKNEWITWSFEFFTLFTFRFTVFGFSIREVSTEGLSLNRI